tara:strand:+ start:288 stop:740 length:453 start_codon:yes stop_codon:yes gene_type:complete
VKIVNYSLVIFILCFIILSLVMDPVEYDSGNQREFPEQIPEVSLNIPLEENLSINRDIDQKFSMPNQGFRTNFDQAWTVKVDTYSDLIELETALKNLKNLGYKVYSRYENDKKDEYGLFIGPTLEKEDSFNVVDELKNINGYNPEVQKYD